MPMRFDADVRARRATREMQHDIVSGRLTLANTKCQVRRRDDAGFANDSLHGSVHQWVHIMTVKRTYITASRLASLEQSLTGRDRRLVSDVDRLGIASGAQLRKLHYSDSDAGRRLCRLHLAALVTKQVFARLSRRIGGKRAGSDGYLYVLDIAGQRLVDPDRKRWWRRTTPGDAFLCHALEVSDLYAGLRYVERRSAICLRTFDAEPVCWRRFSGPGGGWLTLKPDAYTTVEDGGYEDHYFIEVDRATESSSRIAEKARTYVLYFQAGREQARLEIFPQVLFVVPNAARAERIIDTLGRLDADHWKLFAVTTADRAVEYLAGKESARVWPAGENS